MPALIGAESSLHPTDTLTKREGLSTDYRIVLYSSFLGFCGLFAWLFDLQVRVRQVALRRDAWHADAPAEPGTAMEVPGGTPLTTGGA
jgi:hypothetical protein